MAYERSLQLDQDDYAYCDFLHHIEEIENAFTPSVCKRFSNTYFYDLSYPFRLDHFVKETVSDIRSVYGKINIQSIEDRGEFFHAMILREPYKNEFRGILKFTPKNTLSLTSYCVSKDGTKVTSAISFPVLQRESFVESECDALFANNASDSEYEYVSENAWLFLELDDRFRAYPKDGLVTFGLEPKKLSSSLQSLLAAVEQRHEMSGVMYALNDIGFIFQMNTERMKQIFKKRDAIDGRRRTLPTVVRKHKRKGTNIDPFLRSGSKYFSIDNREFSFVFGGDVIDKILVTDHQKELMTKKLQNADKDDYFIFA